MKIGRSCKLIIIHKQSGIVVFSLSFKRERERKIVAFAPLHKLEVEVGIAEFTTGIPREDELCGLFSQ